MLYKCLNIKNGIPRIWAQMILHDFNGTAVKENNKRKSYQNQVSNLSCVTPITWIHLPQMNHSSSWTTHHLEHEIRRRPTDRREVITRITRIFLSTRISQIFVRGGALTWGTNRTNIFISHTDLTDLTDLPMLRMAHGYLFWFVI